VSASPSPAQALRQIFDSFDRGNTERAFALMDDLYAEDLHFQDPIQTTDGKAAFMAMNRRFFGQGQSMRVQVHSVVAEGDEVFVAYTLHYKARFGPALVLEAASHCRARDGKVVHHRDYWDLLGSVMGSLPAIGPVYRALVRHLG
jgi:ketosteroid isomerase-like protein